MYDRKKAVEIAQDVINKALDERKEIEEAYWEAKTKEVLIKKKEEQNAIDDHEINAIGNKAYARKLAINVLGGYPSDEELTKQSKVELEKLNYNWQKRHDRQAKEVQELVIKEKAAEMARDEKALKKYYNSLIDRCDCKDKKEALSKDLNERLNEMDIPTVNITSRPTDEFTESEALAESEENYALLLSRYKVMCQDFQDLSVKWESKLHHDMKRQQNECIRKQVPTTCRFKTAYENNLKELSVKQGKDIEGLARVHEKEVKAVELEYLLRRTGTYDEKEWINIDLPQIMQELTDEELKIQKQMNNEQTSIRDTTIYVLKQ